MHHFRVEAGELDVVRNWRPSAHRHAAEGWQRLHAPWSRVLVLSLALLPVMPLLCPKLRALCSPSLLDLSSEKYWASTNGE